jgi:hypothetical protein
MMKCGLAPVTRAYGLPKNEINRRNLNSRQSDRLTCQRFVNGRRTLFLCVYPKIRFVHVELDLVCLQICRTRAHGHARILQIAHLRVHHRFLPITLISAISLSWNDDRRSSPARSVQEETRSVNAQNIIGKLTF